MTFDPPRSQLTPSVSQEDHSQGTNSAPVTLVEYADYQCPYCRTADAMIKEVQEAMGSRLQFVFRNFPLVESHRYAEIAAEAAEAAGAQGKFWEMHDLLFQHQRALDPEHLQGYARELGLDANRFQEDLEGRRHHQKIDADRRSGEESGVPGTPTFFINGEIYQGEPATASLLQALQQAAEVQ